MTEFTNPTKSKLQSEKLKKIIYFKENNADEVYQTPD